VTTHKSSEDEQRLNQHGHPPGDAQAQRPRATHTPERPRGRYDRISGGPATLWFLALGLALVIALAWGLGLRAANAAQSVALRMERQRAFEQLQARTQTIEILLAKGLVTSGGGAGSLVYTDLWHQGLAAQDNLTSLPVSDVTIQNTARFMTQVADYGRLLVRKATQDERITDEDYNTLLSMHQTAGELALQLNELGNAMAINGFRWETMQMAGGGRRLDQAARPVRDGFAAMAEHMQDLPTLIYDGPYSDHIQGLAPRGLPAGQVTLEQAMQIARRFAPSVQGVNPGTYQVAHAGDVEGRLPAYSLSLTLPGGGAAQPPGPQGQPPGEPQAGRAGVATVDDGARAGIEIRVDVSKQGGQVALMIVQGIEGVDTGLDVEPAGERAPTASGRRWPQFSLSLPMFARQLQPMEDNLAAPAQVPAPVPWPTPEQQAPPPDGQPAQPGQEQDPGLPQQPAPGTAPGAAPGPGAAPPMLTLTQSAERARQFLAERGFNNITPTYASAEEGVATCQFAAMQGQVVLYPDQVKVKVRMSDGQILGFEGMNYLMAHTRRDLPAMRVTEAEARRLLNARVEVVGVRSCVIPTPARGEALCHEFHVRLLDSSFLVYINAVTGNEEAIFKLIDQGENGQLVM
jgi:hypothetical protein